MTSASTPHQALLGIFEHYQPKRMLCISREPIPAALAFCTEHPDCVRVETDQVPLPAELANQRYDLAVVADELERLDKRQGVELIAGLRNLSVSRLAVLVDLQQTPEWKDTDFFGLALQRHGKFERDDRSLSLFTYDLAEYKSVPDWLNSKYWANPQLFGKYWW
ncbi:MAG TPA: hypothetical protein ENI17_03030 [Pseudomonas xinjiangensis]|uniref:Uncharacterized protein n=2 Tax=root TaxID=1 RepID=A0A7V1BMY7_9GAMM|nr:hypothetical protein [Halopseudomonas xinjiangensis]HEC46583.1 hypothetical protein [Halopseudomonas xinjiangensis]